MINKNIGKTIISCNYTLSFAKRRFNIINNNREFYFKFDRRHNFYISLSQKINNFSFNIQWFFSSGYLITIPQSIIFVPNYSNHILNYNLNQQNGVVVYDEINNYRLPPYHRLDISVNYNKNSWDINFGLYNAYNRKNIFTVVTMPPQYFSISLFPILPFLKISKRF